MKNRVGQQPCEYNRDGGVTFKRADMRHLLLLILILSAWACAAEISDMDVGLDEEALTTSCKEMIVQGDSPNLPPADVVVAMAATRVHCGNTNLNGCSATGTLCANGGACQFIYSCPGGVSNIDVVRYPDIILTDLSCGGHDWQFSVDPSNWSNAHFKNATYAARDAFDSSSRYGVSTIAVTSFGALQNTWKVRSCLVKCAGLTGQC